MAIIDVVKWDAVDGEFCYKFPSDNLRIGTQLVVYPAQTAFFVKGGTICDEFEAGTYTIKSENIPILHRLVNIPFGGDSPFKADVWFINRVNKLNISWGTPHPLRDQDRCRQRSDVSQITAKSEEHRDHQNAEHADARTDSPRFQTEDFCECE
jgi:membrane protease subunit (stomatin/prohibitin family)